MGTANVAPVLALVSPHPQSPLPTLYSRKISISRDDYIARRGSFSLKAGGRVGGSEWEKTHSGGRSPYRDEFDYDSDEEEFGFRKNSGKQRIWWSDDTSTTWRDSEGGEDEDDDEEEDGFGVLEGSIGGFGSIFKVFGAFAWVVPAIIVSLLLGTGANAFLMALALPLAQSALSSVIDMIWQRPPNTGRPKSKSRNRKRPFSGASSGSRSREENKTSGDYRSWVATDNVSEGKKREGKARRFGGWDDLDNKRRKAKEPKTTGSSTIEGKLGRRRTRNRQKPLVVRLLIALFPFLGFWTKLW